MHERAEGFTRFKALAVHAYTHTHTHTSARDSLRASSRHDEDEPFLSLRCP